MRCIFTESDVPISPGAQGAELDDGRLDQLYGLLRPEAGDRPWVGLSMIASLDGSTVVDGRSGALGNDDDRAVFGALRRAADVIIVGSATARAEHYCAPQRRNLRIGVVTSTGDVDRSTDLFTSGAGFLLMPHDGPPAPGGIDAVRAGYGRVDLREALAHLEQIMERPGFVQAEGGSHLNGALIDADCVDELNVSLAPLVVGGDGPRLVTGATERFRRFQPVHVLMGDGGYLFSRWVRDRSAPSRW